VDKLEPVILQVLIPVFFVLTGIRTNLIFPAGGRIYLDLAWVLLVAVGSKWGGTMLGGRATGMSWGDACELGLLMNTRGLVELVVLNVGLDSGILSPTMYSIMVSMALLTTFMATPLISLLAREKTVTPILS
jgi:Kef-type K+ transport system membrane component KefB